MKKYLGIVESLVDKFENFEIKQISREDNQQADALANLGSTLDANQDKHIPLYFLTTSALESSGKLINSNNLTWDWRTPLVAYLKDGQLPNDRNEAHRIIIRAARFTILGDELYKRSYAGGPLFKCVSPSELNYVLREVHECNILLLIP